ncbi:HET-domain-containing protein, partial [Pilatotrama ljubarskyi]
MRLLNTHTGLFTATSDPSKVRYAILSHTWVSEGEQTYQDLVNLQSSWSRIAGRLLRLALTEASGLSPKIRGVCERANQDGYEYVWIDSCCIDKTSSAELSEAINSMYEWYKQADVCYVYLADVDANDAVELHTSAFQESRWHKRSWTLQELLAPAHVVFFSKDWLPLGTKATLAGILQAVTGINIDILTHKAPVSSVSVAQRMWWASSRQATRVEDEAYSLMGIFDVHMPTVYGEGRKAFVRLQEEILKACPDQSMFAW